MNEDEVKALETYVKTIVPKNSICLVQVPHEELEAYAKSLQYLNDQFTSMFGIVFVACPMNVKLTVIPAHSEVSLEHEPESTDPLPG